MTEKCSLSLVSLFKKIMDISTDELKLGGEIQKECKEYCSRWRLMLLDISFDIHKISEGD